MMIVCVWVLTCFVANYMCMNENNCGLTEKVVLTKNHVTTKKQVIKEIKAAKVTAATTNQRPRAVRFALACVD